MAYVIPRIQAIIHAKENPGHSHCKRGSQISLGNKNGSISLIFGMGCPVQANVTAATAATANAGTTNSAIQLFLGQKTMDTTQPSLTKFTKSSTQQQVTVPPTAGQELNRFVWLLFRPQAHAVKPFEADQSARQEKYKHTK
jgi:hypothetical protein